MITTCTSTGINRRSGVSCQQNVDFPGCTLYLSEGIVFSILCNALDRSLRLLDRVNRILVECLFRFLLLLLPLLLDLRSELLFCFLLPFLENWKAGTTIL